MVSKPSLVFSSGHNCGSFRPFDQVAGQSCHFPENVVFIQSAFQVVAAARTARAGPVADHAGDHAHVAVAPGGELFIDLEQVVQ